MPKNKKTTFFTLFILFIAIFFRFYNYTNRWGLASDQARDAIVATEALHLHTLPLIGPFSASGPFIFGPYQYWFLMILGIILPFGFFAFWIGLSIVSTLIVLFMIHVGKEIEGIWFGFLLGLFTAISPAQIGLSTNLVSSSLAGFLSMVSVYFLIRCIKYVTPWNFFFLGLFVSLAMNTHFQAIPLFLLLPAAFVSGKWSIKNTFLLVLGTMIPFIPLAIFDIQTHFYESSHLIQFFLFPNTAGSPSNRWLTYAGKTWPRFWALIIGGNLIVGTGAVVLSYILLVFLIIKKRTNRIIVTLASTYLAIFVLLRYFFGHIFGNFTTFVDPFILILVTWTCMEIVKIKKLVGYTVIAIITIFTLIHSYPSIQTATNNTHKNTQYLVNYIHKNFPSNTKFRFYDWEYKTTLISLPLVLYLNQENKLSENGKKLGITNTTEAKGQIIEEDYDIYHEYVFDLQLDSDKTIAKNQWVPITPLSIYNATENWYKK